MMRSRVWSALAVLALLGMVLSGQGLVLADPGGGGHYFPNGKPGNVHWPDKYGRHGAELDYVSRRDGSSGHGVHGAANGSQPAPNPLVNAVSQQNALAATSTVGGAWTSLGPNPINEGDTGRVLALLYDAPLNKLFLGAADGGIWSSTPGGSWTPIGDSLASMAVNTLAIDKKDTTGKTIFAGTGEAARPGDGFDGVGIYKTTDGGSTWNLYGQSLFNHQAISAIVVDPKSYSNANYVYAGIVNDGGSGTTGVAVSSDGGQTWAVPSGSTLAGSDVTDLAIDHNGTVWAGVKGSGVYYSTDHGQTWTAGTGLPGAEGDVYRIALAPSVDTSTTPSTQQTLYAVAGCSGNAGPGGTSCSFGNFLGIYKSTDGGQTWTLSLDGTTTSVNPPSFNQAWYDIYVAVDPTNSSVAYVGLTDILKTSNGGTTWTNQTNVYTGGSTGVHPDQHAAAYVPGGTSGTWYFGNDGGVYASTNAAITFNVDDTNLALSQFYHGAVGNNGYVLGGLQDNGTVDYNNPSPPYGSGWEMVYGGDGTDVAMDPSSNSTAYGAYVYGDIYRTQSGWSSTTDISSGSWAQDAEFVAPFVMDPGNASTIYMGRTQLWKTTNATAGSPSWTAVGPNTNNITAIAVSKSTTSTASTVYMGDDWYDQSGVGRTTEDYHGHLWVSTNGGSTFSSADGSSTVPCTATSTSPRYCPNTGTNATDMAIDPTNTRTVYVTVNGYEGAQKDHIFKSTDGGTTWTDLSTALPDEPFQSVVIDPANNNTIIAGCDTGAFISYDGGSTWSALGTNLPHVAVFSLATDASGATVYAFTHGRGAWSLPIPPAPAGSMSVTIALNNGWTQIDLPVAGSGISQASQLVTSIGSTAKMVATYANGRFNLYLPGYSADVPLGATQGIFVLTNAAASWTVSGQSPSITPVALSAGWNLAAAPAPSSGLTSTTIASQTTCNPQQISLWTGTGYSTWTPSVPTSFTVPANNGVWILCSSAGTWTP